ncbi:MAG: hypothetical protein QOF58_1254, partial [Pseudonocardiales bacterium]|nr:hypothetical protein [Pseudonocardiales bacterium]
MPSIYFTASSVDGFIADPDQTLSWLLSRDVDRRGPMGYDLFIDSVGAMVMGATTYRWILEHDLGEGSSQPWPYDIPCWV